MALQILGKKVLIDPQWNVNPLYIYTRRLDVGVLIDPQWNVNYDDGYKKAWLEFCINRPIVECK